MNKRAIQEKTGDSGGHRHRVLVIDGSRVVRATLAKRLADRFDIVEEANGESAWQRLMLEGNIAAVISGIHPPRLDASDLLARLRSSAMRRLREIPFVLIVSDIENQTTSESVEWKDVTGFITKSMSADTMAAHLDQWLASSSPDVEQEPRVAKRPLPAVGKSDKLLGSKEFSSRVSSLTISSADTVPVCVLVLGIDGLDELVVRFGQDVPDLLRSRIASPLAEKIDPRDQLGLLGEQRLAIISYGVDLRQGARFGKRVCKSLASGQIAIRGQKIRMTVSIGIASTSDDAVASGAELLALAEQRLEQVLVCGGNAVSTEHHPACPLQRQDKSLITLLNVLMRSNDDLSPERRSSLGLAVLPVLHRLDSRLSLGLPLNDIEQRLRQRVGGNNRP